MQNYSQLLHILVSELEYAAEKYVFLRIGKTYIFQKLGNVRIFSNYKSTYRKNLKILRFIGFLGFYISIFTNLSYIYIFTDIKYVFLPRKWLGKYAYHTYGKYLFLRIPYIT